MKRTPTDPYNELTNSVLIGILMLWVLAGLMRVVAPVRLPPEMPEPSNIAVRAARNPAVRTLMIPRVEIQLVGEPADGRR